MNTLILAAALCWLALGGATQVILLVAHFLRQRHSPNCERTLCRERNAILGCAQILFAFLALRLISRSPLVVHQDTFLILTAFAPLCWLAIELILVGRQKPTPTTLIFTLLVMAGALVGP